MKIGFVIPNYNNEKRVALLPKDVKKITKNSVMIEKGFGKYSNIVDSEYEKVGCVIDTRDNIFKNSDILFSLKLIQPSDYNSLRNGQIILGWMHPLGSGYNFYKNICIPKKITIIDTDSTNPRIFKGNIIKTIDEIKINFCAQNSFLSGIASVTHALLSFGTFDIKNKKIAVLSSGNVAQGAFTQLVKIGGTPKMFYRRTIEEFKSQISDFDIIVNGIEIKPNEEHIIDQVLAKKIKRGALVIDAAADAGGAIENSEFTTIDSPIKVIDGIYYYCVNNAPSLLYKDASDIISETFSANIYNLDFDKIIEKYIGDK